MFIAGKFTKAGNTIHFCASSASEIAIAKLGATHLEATRIRPNAKSGMYLIDQQISLVGGVERFGPKRYAALTHLRKSEQPMFCQSSR